MEEIKQYKTGNLILQVNENYSPKKLTLKKWDRYLDILCDNRPYQAEAIKQAIIFLASGQYNATIDLVKENLKDGTKIDLKSRYTSSADYKKHLQLPDKLSANIDLATGTGKSYVIFGIAQIMLGMGFIDRALVLCPSLTIENGLLEKFNALASDKKLRDTVPNDAKYKNPGIKQADVTIKKGDICVENIHAVYSRTGSSIHDSFTGKGEKTLVLSDESHHIFNTVAGNTGAAKDIRKWKEFLLNSDFNFKYILGFTGTAYINDEYFNDVIYRYSLRKAINDGVVKTVDYVSENNDIDKNTKFQMIYDNHQQKKEKYRKIKPLTIFVTKDIANAKRLATSWAEFLQETHELSEQEAQDKVLMVTSHKDHQANIPILKQVDNKECQIEWIISVSMLTEGWDVKNVFQIVPWEDRAFNSKLLIAQVLGRGLRLPPEYQTPQPEVRVFNHAAWSKNIRGLVDEILEIEMRLKSSTLQDDRNRHHFTLYNIDYDKNPSIKNKENLKSQTYDYSKKPIKLTSQIEKSEIETEYTNIGGEVRSKNTLIHYNTWTINEIASNIINNLKVMKWEANILKLTSGLYSKDKLPKKLDIINLIKESMDKVGIDGDRLNEENKLKIESSFNTLLRKFKGTTVYKLVEKDPYAISTKSISAESMAIGNLRQGSTVFYSSNYKDELEDENKKLMQSIIDDESLPKSAEKSINVHKFKTSLDLVFTNKEPERKFVEKLCNKHDLFDSWIKSRDVGFYSIDYSITTSGGRHSKTQSFNPDFFIKVIKNNKIYYIVVEIKSDNDISDENRAKYKYAKRHFDTLNKKLKDKNEIYIFCFLSPDSYEEFFTYLENGKILLNKFRSRLDDKLENNS